MFFNTFITALCITLPILQPYVGAAVLKRDVFDPPITYPTAGTVWRVGETHNVTWNTSILPPNFIGTGMIVLGFLNDTANDGNEHLDLDHPLATGFPLAAGRADITVPAVPPMDSYIIILFGDSGNASPQFTITNISISIPPSSSSSVLASSTSALASVSTPSSAADGSSSIVKTPSPVTGPSSVLIPGSNSAAVATSMLVTPSHSAVRLSSTGSTLASSTGSPFTPVDNSTNGIADTNAAQIVSIPSAVLLFNAAVAIFLSWVL